MSEDVQVEQVGDEQEAVPQRSAGETEQVVDHDPSPRRSQPDVPPDPTPLQHFSAVSLPPRRLDRWGNVLPLGM